MPIQEISSSERLMDAVLLLDVQFQLRPSQIEALAGLAEELGTRALIFMGLKEKAERFVAAHQKTGLVSFHEGATKSELMAPGLTEIAPRAGTVSYLGSAIGQGANMGDHAINVVDSQSYSPTHALVLPEEFDEGDVDYAVARAREQRMIQPAGRNLRRHGEGLQYRVVIAHNPDLEWVVNPHTGKGARAPLPVPPAVVRAIAERVTQVNGKPRLQVVRVTYSFSYLCEAIREFLDSGRVTNTEPPKLRKRQSKAERARGVPSLADPEERRREKRWGVLISLEERRADGMKWKVARRSKGIESPLERYFTAEERDTLRRRYQEGAVLEM